MAGMQITLAAARVNAGLTQSEAAKALHVGKQTISNWESGKSEPTISQYRDLCRIYQMPMEYIFIPEKSN